MIRLDGGYLEGFMLLLTPLVSIAGVQHFLLSPLHGTRDFHEIFHEPTTHLLLDR